MSESRGLVALDEEVTSPGKAVADGNPEQSPNVMATGDRPHEYGQSKQSAASVEKAVPCARVLLQVESKEFVVRGEPVLVRLCHGVLSDYAFEGRTCCGV